MKQRSIPICIILSIVTCGIYSLYWFTTLTDDTNTLAQPTNATSGIVALLLTIVTCNIYGIYWAYQMGARLDEALVQRGKPAQSQAILYLILELVFPIVGWALMQNCINSMILPEGTVG